MLHTLMLVHCMRVVAIGCWCSQGLQQQRAAHIDMPPLMFCLAAYCLLCTSLLSIVDSRSMGPWDCSTVACITVQQLHSMS